MIALRSFGELAMKHKGERICVMGGGATLKEDLTSVDADVWISANQHGARLRPVDYVVAMDNLHTVTKDPMLGVIREFTDAPIIGPWHWCDYGITNYPMAPRLLFTGVISQWVAYVLGAHPIIMAGFDCYGGRHRTFTQHREMAVYVPAAIRVVSGPLIELWPRYDAQERLAPYSPPESFGPIDLIEHGVRVKVIKSVPIRGQEWPIGTVLHVPRAEVWRQLKHRSLMEV